MFKPLLIHKDNTPLKSKFNSSESIKFNIETFDFGNSDLDTYISQNFIPTIEKKDFNIVFIKDNLSDNYLELHGITLAYHIRLSNELGKKQFIPIVIISDVDGYILNKLTPIANILFSKNIFIARNEISSYDYFRKVFEEIKPFNSFQEEFLDLIEVDSPQDYLSHHDIANEWAIYRWAEFLKVQSEAINENKSKIENMLYFKYLKAKYQQIDKDNIEIITSVKKGKVLLIDDEWNKGWNDILQKALQNEHIAFESFKYDYKDKTQFNLYMQIQKKINEFDPDVVILDLRLAQNDHENEDIDSYTGIKILQKIHQINVGIQVIMLTATSKSTILEKLYEKKILGYIKKAHPNDISINTVENINKFIKLVDKGLERKYLKEVFIIQKEILNLKLFVDLKFSFEMDDSTKKLFELKNTVSKIFETLDSNIPKPFIYGMLTIYKCIEIINDYYIYEKYDTTMRRSKAYWVYNDQLIDNDGNSSVKNKIKSILIYLQIQNNRLIKHIDEISCTRNYEIHSGEIKYECKNKIVLDINHSNILNWFGMLKIILENINRQNMTN